MCRRDANDELIRRFLDRYNVNLLSMPGRRVQCGSVYIEESGRFTAPGLLSDIVEPKITLRKPFEEPKLPDLSGTWSGSVSVKIGIGLLENFLTALGAAGLIHELKASVQNTNARNFAFRFARVSRESLVPTALGRALIGRHFLQSHPWVSQGNRYYVVAAVLRSNSISVRGLDKRDSAVDLGAGVATMADVHTGVQVTKASTSELVYSGRDPLAIGVELYELRWDEGENELAFHTPKGPIRVHGLTETNLPPPAFVGNEDNVLVDVQELASAG
jgi:hypothetical protein